MWYYYHCECICSQIGTAGYNTVYVFSCDSLNLQNSVKFIQGKLYSCGNLHYVELIKIEFRK